MRILVTGGAGFIGSALCRHLITQTRDEVINVDKLTYAGTLASVKEIATAPGYTFCEADIADQDEMRRLMAVHQPDVVMNLAAESHVDRSIEGAHEFVQTNIVGVYSLLEAARDYWRDLPPERRATFRFHQISTDEVFGSLGPVGQFCETTPYDPRSPYAASKAAGDHLVRAWGHTYGLPVLLTNCSNNFGPYHFPEKLIPLMILNGLEGRRLPVYGDGSNVRDWIYVEDHVCALRLIVEKGRAGESYNVGASSERTNLQVVQTICDLLDEMSPDPAIGSRRSLIQFVEDRPGHDRRYAIDSTKLMDELGWRPQETFESGLRKSVRWFLDHRDWWRPLRARYSGKRLGTLNTSAAVP